MSHFALLGPFQPQFKWKFFKYLTFFGIFFKIFVLWGPLNVYRLEFHENLFVSEFNEI